VPDGEPSHVYGGEPSATCNWPSTVFLGGCSGTLIHPEVVMYAGHCGDVIPEVFFGEDFSNPDAPGEGFSVATEYCMTNPAAQDVFIEEQSGLDVTPCHYATGEWNPSPACRDFPLAPEDGQSWAWAEGCAGGPISEWGTACGPAFDTSRDLDGPATSIIDPEDRSRFDTESDETSYVLTIRATAVDETSGVQHVALAIDGALVDGGQRRAPPWKWTITLPPGVWVLHVAATDWAGNIGESPVVVVGIDEDPPAAPEPSTSSGADPDTSSSGASHESTTSTTDTSTTSTSTGSDTTDGAAAPSVGDGGCGCGSSNDRAAWMWGLLLLVPARRRRIGTPWAHPVGDPHVTPVSALPVMSE